MSEQTPPPNERGPREPGDGGEANPDRTRRPRAARNRAADRKFALDNARRDLNKAKQDLADAEKEKQGETSLRRLREAVQRAQKAFDRLNNAEGRQLERRVNKYLDDYYADYGWWVRELVNSDPELRRVFQRAIRQGLDADQFVQELMQTDWWQDPKRDQTWREAFMLEYGLSPGDWNTTLEDAKVTIQDVADDVLDRELTEYELEQISRRYIYQGWDQNNFRDLRAWLVANDTRSENVVGNATKRLENAEQKLADAQARGARKDVIRRLQARVDDARAAVESANTVAGGPRGVGGSLVTTEKSLQDMARQFGLDYEAAWYTERSRLINDPNARMSIEDIAAEMAQAAADLYPVFKDRLGVGADGQITTVRDLAGAYIGQLSRLLEIDGDQIDLRDPLLAKAFNSQMDESNNPKLMSLWDFQKEIRKDDRWQETGNALDIYSRIGSELTRAMGFAR